MSTLKTNLNARSAEVRANAGAMSALVADLHAKIDQVALGGEMNLPDANRSDGFDPMARPADIGQAIAAVIAITRREWMAQEPASPALVLRPPLPMMDGRRQRVAPENAP
jgi:hypothetical protein